MTPSPPSTSASTRHPASLRHRLGGVLTVFALLVGGLIGLAAPSSASSSCTYPACSSIANRSGLGVYVARDWCGTLEQLTQNSPPCGAANTDHWLADGAGTPSHEDWDTFRVDAGWCYQIRTWHKIGYNTYATINRIGQSTAVWVRVHNDQIAFITSQGSSSC